MSRFESRFENYAQELKARFQRLKSSHTDSDVKGDQNEKIVAEFLREHFPATFISTGVQIFDSNDNMSDELDICVCNSDQSLAQEGGGLFIAEGVDFVVQVKATLTDKEIDRALSNCKTVKQLERKFGKGDQVLSAPEADKSYLSRIPYIIVAFESQLSPDTLHEKVIEKCSQINLIHQPDALFVINRGLTFINCRNGQTHWKSGNNPLKDWIRLESGDKTLLELIRYAHVEVPKFIRLTYPLAHYFSLSPSYKVIGKTETK